MTWSSCCVHHWKNLTLLLRILVAIQILGQHLQARTNSPMMTQRAWSGRCRETVKTQSLKWWPMFFHSVLPQLRATFALMDHVDVSAILRQRAAVMKSVPRFLHGPFRNTLKVPWRRPPVQIRRDRREDGKCSCCCPGCFLHRPPGGGHISRDKLTSRFEVFRRGEWRSLMEASAQCEVRAAQALGDDAVKMTSGATGNPCRDVDPPLGSSPTRGKFWRVPNLPLAIKPQWTRCRTKRGDLHCHVVFCPQTLRTTCPSDQYNWTNTSSVGIFDRPGGEQQQVRPEWPWNTCALLLDDVRALHLFFLMEEQLAQAKVPLSIVNLIRMVRLTAVSKPDGGVRSIVGGDVVRRLWWHGRSLSSWLPPLNVQPAHTNMR